MMADMTQGIGFQAHLVVENKLELLFAYLARFMSLSKSIAMTKRSMDAKRTNLVRGSRRLHGYHHEAFNLSLRIRA